MDIGWIGQNELVNFGPLLLPHVRQALERGEPITALGLTDARQACGAAAAWLHGEGVLELCSLYVAPSCRRQGGGRLLVETFCRLVQGRCHTAVIHYTSTQPDHETLPPFLTAVGFTQEGSGSGLYQIVLSELAQAPFFARRRPSQKGITSFAQVPSQALRAAYQTAVAQGEDYLEYPLDDPAVDQQASVAVVEGETVRSFAVITHPAAGRIRLEWVKSGQPQDLPLLLHGVFARVQETYPPDTVLTVQAVTQASEQLVAGLIPAARPISCSFFRKLT